MGFLMWSSLVVYPTMHLPVMEISRLTYSFLLFFLPLWEWCWLLLLLVLLPCHSASPLPPVLCNDTRCLISNAYGVWPDRSLCIAASVVYPTTEEEILGIVAAAVQRNQKMKVVTRWSHSIPKLACPGGDSGLVISTANYNSEITVTRNVNGGTVTVDSGVELRQLIDEIAIHGLALPYTPYWDGLTIGGLLCTGVHGSSLFNKGGAVHEYVTSMRLVVPGLKEEGFAKIITLTHQDEDLNAAKVSLGVLGVITKVTLVLEPMFKRSITFKSEPDHDLESQIIPFANGHEFGDISWYPSQNKAIYRLDDRVPINTSGDAVNDFIGFRPTRPLPIQIVRDLENAYEATMNSEGKCITGRIQTSSLLALAYGLKNNALLFNGLPIVGYQNKLQASSLCLNSIKDFCPWDIRIKGEFFHQTTFSISLSHIGDFIKEVKALRDLNPKGLCGVDLYNGFLMRFKKASLAYLGEQEDSVDIDITYYRAQDAKTPRLNEDLLEEIEQMGLYKYGGRPHWGKNRNLAFDKVWLKYPNLQKFLDVKERMDPKGLFSNEWSNAILGIEGDVMKTYEHCALEGMCICSDDLHCAPMKNYKCMFGKLYTEAKVCKHEIS